MWFRQQAVKRDTDNATNIILTNCMQKESKSLTPTDTFQFEIGEPFGTKKIIY